MLVAKPAAKLTYADYLDVPGDQRYELIDGDLIVVGSPNIAHQMISMGLALEVGELREGARAWLGLPRSHRRSPDGYGRSAA